MSWMTQWIPPRVPSWNFPRWIRRLSRLASPEVMEKSHWLRMPVWTLLGRNQLFAMTSSLDVWIQRYDMIFHISETGWLHDSNSFDTLGHKIEDILNITMSFAKENPGQFRCPPAGLHIAFLGAPWRSSLGSRSLEKFERKKIDYFLVEYISNLHISGFQRFFP